MDICPFDSLCLIFFQVRFIRIQRRVNMRCVLLTRRLPEIGRNRKRKKERKGQRERAREKEVNVLFAADYLSAL